MGMNTDSPNLICFVSVTAFQVTGTQGYYLFYKWLKLSITLTKQSLIGENEYYTILLLIIATEFFASTEWQNIQPL